MPQPYATGTVVTHQRQDSQGNPVGAPYDAVWQPGGVVDFYYPQPGTPPGNDYKKVTGSWNEVLGAVLLPDFEYYYGPGASFSCRQGTLQISHGSATAVA